MPVTVKSAKKYIIPETYSFKIQNKYTNLKTLLTQTNKRVETTNQEMNQQMKGTTTNILFSKSKNGDMMIKDEYLNLNDDGTGTYYYGIDIAANPSLISDSLPTFEGVNINKNDYYMYMFTLLVQQTIDPRSITGTSEFAILHTKIQLACTTQSMTNGGLIILAESNFTCLGDVNSVNKTISLIPLAYQNIPDNSLLSVDTNGDWNLTLRVNQEPEVLEETLKQLIDNTYDI